MLNGKLSVVCAGAVVNLALLLTGCSSVNTDATAGWNPNKIYAAAKDEMNAGAYDKAIALFDKLEGRAAGTPLAQQAQLDKAYAHYKAAEAPQAIATKVLSRSLCSSAYCLAPAKANAPAGSRTLRVS